LIVVSFSFGLIVGHKVIVGADLELHGLRDNVIELGISCQVPVIDERTPHSTGFPPVVRCWEETWSLARLVASVESDKGFGQRGSGRLDGICLVHMLAIVIIEHAMVE
jgi:hypothetical protein